MGLWKNVTLIMGVYSSRKYLGNVMRIIAEFTTKQLKYEEFRVIEKNKNH